MPRMVIEIAPYLSVRRSNAGAPGPLARRTVGGVAKHAPGIDAQTITQLPRLLVHKRPRTLTLLCLLSVFLLPHVILAQAGSLAVLDNEYGLDGLHFGDGLATLTGAKLVAERGVCEKVYTRPADKLELQGVKLSGIEYSLQNGRLTVISLLAAADACPKLYRALTQKYGEDTSKQAAEVASQPFWTATWEAQRVRLDLVGPTGCTATITAPEEAILEERQCREDDRMDAGKGR